MLKKILLILLILSLSSCGRYWYKPYGRIFKQAPKDGTPGLELGWLHGCESGFSTQFGAAIYMSFYSWKRDPDIIRANPTPEDIARIRERYANERIAKIDWNNPIEVKKNFNDYNTIFWGAHIFCRHIVVGQLQMSGMEPTVPGGQSTTIPGSRYDPGAHSLGNILKIDGKGDSRLSYW